MKFEINIEAENAMGIAVLLRQAAVQLESAVAAGKGEAQRLCLELRPALAVEPVIPASYVRPASLAEVIKAAPVYAYSDGEIYSVQGFDPERVRTVRLRYNLEDYCFTLGEIRSRFIWSQDGEHWYGFNVYANDGSFVPVNGPQKENKDGK